MSNRASLYIGLISGTSVDGIDAVLAEFGDSDINLIKGYRFDIEPVLQQKLLSFNSPQADELDNYAYCDVQLGRQLAQCVANLLLETGYSAADISAIGSHGQTIRHYPAGSTPTTLQIGDPNIIAELTGITTIADFRRRDMACGGQGAPLVPAFHHQVFRDASEHRAVLNLGGIANLTLLPADMNQPVRGFDTGPANCLLNDWIKDRLQLDFDDQGAWSASGQVNSPLLEAMLTDTYFAQAIPKSTGRDYFQLAWIKRYLADFPGIEDQDIQATLAELTAITVAMALTQYAPQTQRLLVCGGGIHNKDLLARLSKQLSEVTVESTEAYGIDPDYVEAIAFAWLAKRTMAHETGSLCSVTGARQDRILGGIYQS